MENNNPADHGDGRRREAEQAEMADLLAAYIQRLDSLEENLNQLIQCTNVPPNTTRAKIMHIYRLLKIVKMGGRDIDPRFRLASTLVAVAVAFGCVKCGLLIYVLLGDMPWLTVVPCVLLIAFAFFMN